MQSTPRGPDAPRVPCVPRGPAEPGGPRPGHAQSVAGASENVTAHIRKHVGPHHPCREPARNRGEAAMIVSR
eukprot:6986378-Pyramimonas_sp.AAC.1